MTREQILDAYKAFAARTKGAPPGKRQFLKAYPELNDHVFRSGFWRSWKAFQLDAGIAPNAKVQRLPDRPILEGLARLTRKLGRVPTTDDIAFARKSDNTIPSEATVRKRAPTDAARAALLQEFCASSAEWADVLGLIKPALQVAAARPNTQHAVVYLMQHGKRFKVGKSVDLDERLRNAKTWITDARYLWYIETDDPFGVEKYWHGRFKAKSLGGEWFRLSNDDVAAFKKWRRIV